MADNITSPLLKEHAKIREVAGQMKAFLGQFDLPGLRRCVQQLKDLSGPHVLKEEMVLYLIGFKFLRADNTLVPELIKEHHTQGNRLNTLYNLLYSSRLTDNEEQIQQLVFVLLEELNEHMEEEESVVWPALEKFIDPQTKDLILTRYQSIETDGFDEFDRVPLLSMPDLADSSGVTTPVNQQPPL